MNQLTVSLWGDEAFASILAQKNLFDIITIVARDTSPPLHYILLHFWMKLFGTSEVAIRSFPLLLFILLAFVVYYFTKEVFNQKAARIAFVLTILNPFLFLYAFEARMYMLLALTAAASMWFFTTKRWLPYVLATTASLYTHHFSLFIVFVQVIYYLTTNFTYILNIKQQLNSPFVKSLFVIVVLYIPWLPALYTQTTMVTGDFWLARPTGFDLRELFYHFVIGFVKTGFENVLLWLAGIILAIRVLNVKKDSLFVLWAIIPPVATFLLSQISRPIFFDRYLIVSATAIPILLATSTRKWVSLLIALLAAGLFLTNIQSFQNPVKQPFRDVASFVHETYGKDKTVVNYYTNALHYFELKHYDVNVKIYSPQGPLPFWVGTALIDKNDVLDKLPEDEIILIMASGNINDIQIPGYKEQSRKQFRDLFLFLFSKVVK